MRASPLLALALVACTTPPPSPGSLVRLETLRPLTPREAALPGQAVAADAAEVAAGRITVARCATGPHDVSIAYLRGAEALPPGTLVRAEAGDPAARDGARPARFLDVLPGPQPVFQVRSVQVIRCQGP
jgi:hypothetical protein